ncbi:MAG: type II secretion system protein [Acidobacteria bacterium]|nr:type II secretion system protein [Acidobacteriota bacterium]
MKRRRGFTLLEMIVATTILAVAVVGLLSALAGITRNAARLREYDRAAQLARLRMNDLLTDYKAPRDQALAGLFDPRLTGGTEAGWVAKVTTVEISPVVVYNDFALDRIELEVWWMAGAQRRSLRVEGYRRRQMTNDDLAGAGK